MPRRSAPERRDEELTMAVGLVWGHLHAQQPDDAYQLATGCLQLWPGERSLSLMAAYAAAELAEPVDLAQLRRLGTITGTGLDGVAGADVAAWTDLVARRSQGM